MTSSLKTSEKIISYLTFSLGEEHFAINVAEVLNILEMMPITKVPKTPEFITGVINLRGEVLPVIDTNIKLGMEKTEHTGSTCILVIETTLENEKVKLGALVDAVQEVLEFEDDQILPPPAVGNTYTSEILRGVVESDDKFILMLDINKILSDREIQTLKKIQK